MNDIDHGQQPTPIEGGGKLDQAVASFTAALARMDADPAAAARIAALADLTDAQLATEEGSRPAALAVERIPARAQASTARAAVNRVRQDPDWTARTGVLEAEREHDALAGMAAADSGFDTRSISSPRGNDRSKVTATTRLPAEPTGFVGREAELARVSALLDSARLVTIVGPGGVGKTRLALRAAARAGDRYPGGVGLVELSDVTDPALLVGAVADCLGLADPDPGSVARYLAREGMLLVLDTCEHLIDACATFTEQVLTTAPGVTLLVTSRQPLDVDGEHVLLLAPMPVPAGGGDAAELFAQRAAAAVPGFRVTASNRADVVRLCQRLEGIPLAIELAAVRLRALPLNELTQRLDDRFQLLASGRRGAAARHQTLRAVIEWSHQLCSAAERELWARLSVFTSPFDIDAAHEVCAPPGATREQTLEILAALVDKSVVARVPADGTRYQLLDTLREFGAEQLAARASDEVRDRLLARCLRLASRCSRQSQQADQEAECAAEFRQALRATRELGDLAGIACALEVLGWLATRQGRPERTAWLLGAAGQARKQAGTPLHDTGLEGAAAVEEFRHAAEQAARQALGDKRYASLASAGARQPLAQVIEHALADADEPRKHEPRSEHGPQAASQGGRLTTREHKIASLVASGLSNREIATQLFISKRTVDAHVEHIFTKLGTSSRTQLTSWLQDRPR